MTAESIASLAKKSARLYTQMALDEALEKFKTEQKLAIAVKAADEVVEEHAVEKSQDPKRRDSKK